MCLIEQKPKIKGFISPLVVEHTAKKTISINLMIYVNFIHQKIVYAIELLLCLISVSIVCIQPKSFCSFQKCSLGER